MTKLERNLLISIALLSISFLMFALAVGTNREGDYIVGIVTLFAFGWKLDQSIRHFYKQTQHERIVLKDS